MNIEMMNSIGSQGKAPRSYNYDINEDEKYIDRNIVGFCAKGQGSNRTLRT